MNKESILILGAGPAGLAAAFELQRTDKSIMIIEKNDTIAGLSKTYKYGNFRTDIGPHRFFSQNLYLNNLINDLLGDRLITVDRLTRFYVDGKLFFYPIQIRNILTNIRTRKKIMIILDYLIEQARKVCTEKNHTSFKDQAISDYGRTLCELNILNYTEKVMGLTCSKLSSDWAKERLDGLTAGELIKSSIAKFGKKPRTLVDRFHYPDTGIGLICEKLSEKILDRGGNIVLNSRPLRIKRNHNRIEEVVLDIDGEIQVKKPKYIISTIPITGLVSSLYPKAPEAVFQSVNNLKFRSHVSLFITLDKPSVFRDQWVYFPEKKIPFARITEPKNFSNKMSPKNQTSLLIEFFCWKNDRIWTSDKQELLDRSIPWLENINSVKSEEVLESFLFKEENAYPVYSLHYKHHLNRVYEHLHRLNNLLCIGRSGTFKYINQDKALEMGLLAAKKIIAGKN